MIWFIAWIIGIIVLIGILVVAVQRRDGFPGEDEVFVLSIACIFWPVSLSIVVVYLIASVIMGKCNV